MLFCFNVPIWYVEHFETYSVLLICININKAFLQFFIAPSNLNDQLKLKYYTLIFDCGPQL